MNWRQREKEKYSYYVTGVTLSVIFIVSANVFSIIVFV